MSFREVRLFSRSIRQARKNKLDAERLSGRIDAMIRCTQARINLTSGFSELKAQLDIGLE